MNNNPVFLPLFSLFFILKAEAFCEYGELRIHNTSPRTIYCRIERNHQIPLLKTFSSSEMSKAICTSQERNYVGCSYLPVCFTHFKDCYKNAIEPAIDCATSGTLHEKYHCAFGSNGWYK